MSRRERVLKAVADLIAEHGHSPSLQEICDAAELGHRSMALHYLRALRAEGKLTFAERDGRMLPRTVRLVEREPAQP